MADRTFTVRARITAEDKASGEVRKVQSTFGRLTSSLKRNALAIGLSLGGAVLAFRGLTRAIGSTIAAAREQEDSVRALDAALIPLGATADGVSKRLQEQAAALQQVTKFGDETIIRGQALIASFTRNEEEIQKATIAALDLAAATGTDLKAAFLLMGRAASGETSTLSRYGIILDKGIPQSEKFAAALEKINEQFGGQAQEQAKTFSGAMAQIGNAFGDLQEKVGESITKNAEVLQQLEDLKNLLTSEGTVQGVTDLAESMVDLTVNAAKATSELAAIILAIRQLSQFGSQNEEIMRIQADILRDFGTEAEKAAERARIFASVTDETAFRMLGFGEQAKVASEKFVDLGLEVDGTTDSIKKLKGESASATDVLLKLAQSLNITTSAQIAQEIADIAIQLEVVRREAALTPAEFERIEAVATAKIASLKEQLRSLQSGEVDLQAETARTADSFGALGDQLSEAERRTNTLAVANAALTTRLLEVAEATGQVATAEGGRIRLEGGGTRLLGSPGASSFAQVGGGTFTRIDPLPIVNPDGTVTIPPIIAGPFFGIG